MNPEIKICGLTRPKEAEMLNEIKADYAGFVFVEKSKRNVTVEQAVEIRRRLDDRIIPVAVTVSPGLELLNQIEAAGFGILQVHGELSPELLKQCRIPIWRACNLKGREEQEGLRKPEVQEGLEGLEVHEKIEGYVIDAMKAGSGRTFNWQENRKRIQELRRAKLKEKKFILAGGLNPENVQEGIALLLPDVVDVSSGVEGADGKEEALIRLFAGKVRGHE